MSDDKQLTEMSKAGIGYLASDPEQLVRFMNETGYDSVGLREALGSHNLAMAVLDYFAANEACLLAMCANSDVTVAGFMRVWQHLNAHE